MEAPTLSQGQVSLLNAEVKTGHVLQVNGELFLGEGETFMIFDSLTSCKSYVANELSRNEWIEFVIFDSLGEYLSVQREIK